jgi:S-adenosylmethionine-dependent methyltransferase
MTLAETFNSHMSVWTAEQDKPWFRLRYTTAQANLRRHLAQPPLQILDMGGGNGREALPLAALGHTVTLVDFSTEMLADARRNAEAAGLAERLVTHEAAISALPGLFAPSSFDVVLCHNVLQYVDDPATALADLAALARPGGLLSVIAPNRYGEPYLSAMLRLDPQEALDHLDATTVVARLFDVPVQRFTGEEMIGLLADAGCNLAGHYGILSVCAYIADNEPKYDPTFFAPLEVLELALADRYPYYLLARFFHVIARKGGR